VRAGLGDNAGLVGAAALVLFNERGEQADQHGAI
jgi:hypothetical protein